MSAGAGAAAPGLQKPTPPPPGEVVVVVGGGGWVVGVVVVGGGEVVGVVVAGGEVVGDVVGVRVVVVVCPAVVDVVVDDFPPDVDDPFAGEVVGVVVEPEVDGVAEAAGLAVTTTDHFPHASTTLPLACPALVSPTKR
jgi:hypothetical protein